MALSGAKKTAVHLPQNIEEVDGLIAMIGQLQRQLQSVESNMNEQIDKIKEESGAQADELRHTIDDHVASVEAYCSVHRDKLTDSGKKKTVKLRSGEVRWRLTPPAISIGNAKAVIAALEKLGLNRFLRIKTEVNRQALLAEPEVAENVPGVSVTQREEFVIVPDNSQAEAIKRGKVV